MEVLYVVTYVIIIFSIFFWLYKLRYSKWKKDFPLTFQEYVSTNPTVKTGNGIKCIFCGSKSLKNWGIDGPESKKRSVTCNHCSSRLYRVED